MTKCYKLCRLLLRGVTVACMLLSAAYGQTFKKDFSADYISNLRGHETTSHFYASKNMIRTETSRNGATAIKIQDPNAKTAWILSPQRKIAMDVSAQYRAVIEAVAGLFGGKPVDPDNPCAGIQGCTAKKLGSEIVNGRQTKKWEIKDKDGKSMIAWIDPTLPLVVRTQYEQGSVEFRNIKEGPQPESLFQVPPDYRKLAGPSSGAPPTRNDNRRVVGPSEADLNLQVPRWGAANCH
jgi:hypothetical protein